MTALPLGRAAFLSPWRGGDPAFLATGLLMLAAMLPLGVAALVDDRLLLGAPIWLKPLKFAAALALYALTLALYARALPDGFAAGRAYRVFRAAVIAAMALELAWIAAAAAAGTASHFNQDGVWAAIYPVMGLLATLLTSASAVLAVGVSRSRGLPPALQTGLVWGLGLTLPLTLVTAFTLSAGAGHIVGGPQDAGEGLPFFSWSRQWGDLRVPHFFATHVLHAVPAAGLLAAWLGLGRGPVRLAALAYLAFVAAVFAQALSGRPFLPGLG